MPEIWLPYGAVEVAVELRHENIMMMAQVEPHPIAGEALREAAGVFGSGEGTVLVLSDSEPVGELLSMAGRGWRVMAPRRLQSKARRWADAHGHRWAPLTLEAVRVDGVELPLPGGPKPLVVLGEARFDPLFGVEGPVAQLLRGSGQALKGHLEALREGPQVGVETEAWKMADEVAEKLGDIQAVEVVEVCSIPAHVSYGPLAEAHRRATRFLMEAGTLRVEGGARLALVSAGGGRWDSTLSGALRALWNVVGVVRPGGAVVLVAECGEGLGSPGLEERVYSRQVRTSGYSEGLEDVLLMEWARERYSITLVSTLPRAWVEGRLGLKAGGSATKALSEHMTPRSRVLVVPRAGSLALRSQ